MSSPLWLLTSEDKLQNEMFKYLFLSDSSDTNPLLFPLGMARFVHGLCELYMCVFLCLQETHPDILEFKDK